MGARRTMEIAERPEVTRARKVAASMKSQIVKLYDLPMSSIRIAEELNLPASAVRRTLAEMVPADAKLWREL